MALSKTMEDAVKEQDLGKIYSSFYTILLSDPGFATGKFDETFEIVKKRNVPGFIQKYNGVPFEKESQWNQQYWDRLLSELMDNFCIERIEHLKDVSRKVYPQEEQKQASEQKKTDPLQTENVQKSLNTGRLILILAGILILMILVIVLIS